MKTTIIGLFFLIMSTQLSHGQPGLNPTNRTFTAAEQEVINLSKDKWQWMADKNAVGDNEVTNPFMVTEVYIKQNGTWKMGSLSSISTTGRSGNTTGRPLIGPYGLPIEAVLPQPSWFQQAWARAPKLGASASVRQCNPSRPVQPLARASTASWRVRPTHNCTAARPLSPSPWTISSSSKP